MPTWGTLGPDAFDPSAFGDGDWEGLRQQLFHLLEMLRAAGSFAASNDTGNASYQAMYAQNVGGTWTLYAGNPDAPMSPDVVTNPTGSASIAVQEEGSTVITTETLNFVGDGVTVTDGGTKAIITIPGGGAGTVSEAYKTIQVSGQDDVVADSATDILTLVAGSNITITTDATADSITIAASGLPTAAFTTIAVSGQSDVVADSASDTLTLVAGSNMTITTNASGDSITFASSGGGTVTAGNYIDVSGSTVSVDFTEVSGFTGDYVLGANAGGTDAVFATIATWLTKLGGWGTASYMSIGNGSGTPVWEADGVC